MQVQTIGLDVGFGFTKAVTNGREIVFPSIVGPSINVRYQNEMVTSGGGQVYHVGGQGWFIGDYAKLQSPETFSPRARERTGTLAVKVLLCAALHQIGAGGAVNLVTGLPVEWYSDRSELLSQMRGLHVFTVDGQEYRIDVQNVAVVPQPFGSYFTLILDSQGRMVNEALAEARVAVLDVGMLTTDFALADGLRYVEKASGSIPVAMARVYEQIARDVQARYRLALDAHDVDFAIRAGHVVKVHGDPKDIADLARPALRAVAETILAQAVTLWGDGRNLDRVAVTGGGAFALLDFVTARYPHAVMVDAPGFGNARGFYYYGLRKWA